MDRAAPAIDTLSALELRVLEGPQRGARAPLAVGSAWVLACGPRGGAGHEADIVLHEPDATPARLRVTADIGQAMVEVLAGEVSLAGQVLASGAHGVWPRQAPLRIGASVVAWGLACIDEWTAASAAAAAAGAAATPSHAEGALALPTLRSAPLRKRAEVWLAATGAGLMLACVGSFWMARVAAAPHRPGAPPTLAAALKSSEFAALQAQPRADGRLLLSGRLASLAQRSRLEAWLAERGFEPTVDVQVDEALARDVTEVFRVNGVAVRARVAGPGRIEADAAEPDAVRVARAEEVVRRDVRGLDTLTLRNSAPPAPAAAPVLPNDPAKRIASLVQGDPAYVVTADGARYFVGALLPSGHRLTAVAPQSVTLERDGRPTTLNF